TIQEKEQALGALQKQLIDAHKTLMEKERALAAAAQADAERAMAAGQAGANIQAVEARHQADRQALDAKVREADARAQKLEEELAGGREGREAREQALKAAKAEADALRARGAEAAQALEKLKGDAAAAAKAAGDATGAAAAFAKTAEDLKKGLADREAALK